MAYSQSTKVKMKTRIQSMTTAQQIGGMHKYRTTPKEYCSNGEYFTKTYKRTI